MIARQLDELGPRYIEGGGRARTQDREFSSVSASWN
jgi:hypothetical protein